MNRKFVSKSNRVLRKVLNSEGSLDILQDFIETFLEIKIETIQLNPYLKSNSRYLPSEENFGIADVRIKLDTKEEYNVGIQFIDGYYAQNKMLLYYAQIHENQLKYQDNRLMAKTITINILDFVYLKTLNYFSRIILPSNLQNQIELYVLELPKFRLTTAEKIDKKEAWMLYLCGKVHDTKSIFRKFDKIQKLDDLLDNYWKNEVME